MKYGRGEWGSPGPLSTMRYKLILIYHIHCSTALNEVALVQQVILENQASLYCYRYVYLYCRALISSIGITTFVFLHVNFQWIVFLSLHRHLLHRLYFARSSRQKMLCRGNERYLRGMGPLLVLVSQGFGKCRFVTCKIGSFCVV